MKNHQHCNICKHVDARLSSGIFCGLTDKRPDFTTSCITFRLDDYRSFELKELRRNLEQIELKRKRFTLRFYSMLLIGLITIALGFYLFIASKNSIHAVKISTLICGIGFTIWTIALIQRSKLKRAEYRILNKIEEFEEVLQYYNGHRWS
jgi:hypothetical protein